MEKDITVLTQKAIKLALDGKWQEAVDLNLKIYKIKPKDIYTLLRLAKAFTNLNNISNAKKYYRKVLSIDKYNPIAKRNLNRLKNIKNGSLNRSSLPQTAVFLEEPGKTKSLYLVRLADENKLASLEVGEPLQLVINPKSISINKDREHLGKLPDDLAFRLIHLIKKGNKYQAFVMSVEKNKLKIFLKEIFKSKRNQQIQSFSSKGNKKEYYSFMPSEFLNEPPIEEIET